MDKNECLACGGDGCSICKRQQEETHEGSNAKPAEQAEEAGAEAEAEAEARAAADWARCVEQLGLEGVATESLPNGERPAALHAVIARVLRDTTVVGDGSEDDCPLRRGDAVRVVSVCDGRRWQVQGNCAGNGFGGWANKECLELLGCHCASCRAFRQKEQLGVAGGGGAAPSGDAEVAKVLAFWSTDAGAMAAFWRADVCNSFWAHVAAATAALLLLAAAAARSPSPAVLFFGTSAAYLGVDLASTVYHIALDNGFFHGEERTVTDAHHHVPLNYVLFDRWQLLASSYVILFPCSLLNFLIWALLGGLLGLSNGGDFMATYCAAFHLIGLTPGFVHVAVHRRNHGLPLCAWVRLLQDAGIILSPERHSLHHRDDHGINYSLFSGATHPISNPLVRFARRRGWLPPTFESQIVRLLSDVQSELQILRERPGASIDAYLECVKGHVMPIYIDDMTPEQDAKFCEVVSEAMLTRTKGATNFALMPSGRFAEDNDPEYVATLEYVCKYRAWLDRSRALTMCTPTRLDNARELVESVLRNDCPGDIVECGVWKGGCSIYMRAVLEAHACKDRKVWVCDSFQGMPPKRQDDENDAAAQGVLQLLDNFAASLPDVQEHFAMFGLLDDSVEFVEGFFENSLCVAPFDRIAVLRLDGDYYSSTMDILNALYGKVSNGGWVIIDDYGISALGCKRAVDEFREARGIVEPLQSADEQCFFWQVQKCWLRSVLS